jgi:hypothetical protein
MIRRLLGLLLFATPCLAHTNIRPIQVAQCPAGATGFFDRSTCVFQKPTLPDDLIIFIISGFYGPSNTLADTQGNAFGDPVSVPYGSSLFYALRTKGGPDGVVLPPNVGFNAIILEYPPALAFEGGANGTYFSENAALGVPNGSSSDLGWTTPVEATAPDDLVIAWGKSNTHPNQGAAALPGPFFKIEALVDECFAAEDMTGQGLGLYIGTMGWNVYSHWTLGVALFKMVERSSLPIQNGATFEPTGSQLTYSYTFPYENFAGDTLVLPEVGVIASVTDTNGNQWQMDQNTLYLGFWHASNIKGGANTVTVTLTRPGAFAGLFAEYPHTSSVQVSSITNKNAATSVASPTLIAPDSGIVIGFGVEWTSYGINPASIANGFSMVEQMNLYFADKPARGGDVGFSATYAHPVNSFIGEAVLSQEPQIIQ